MEKVQSLPFELNIELIGPFLYFYTKDRGTEAMDGYAADHFMGVRRDETVKIGLSRALCVRAI